MAIAVIIRALNPSLYVRVLEKSTTTDELKVFFGINSDKLGEGYDDHQKFILHGTLAFMTGAHNEMSSDEKEQFGRGLDRFSDVEGGWDNLVRIIHDLIEAYSFPETDVSKQV